MAVALSGGMDSVVLLDILAKLRPELDLDLTALHVNHGLSRNAARWEAHCRELAAARGIAFDCDRVSLDRSHSSGLEAHARDVRHASLRRMAVEHHVPILAFAHHADDQAETVLLQLLRGGAPRGLAAMGEWIDDEVPCVAGPAGAVGAVGAVGGAGGAGGVTATSGAAAKSLPIARWRPLLAVPRAEIAHYASANRLEWVDDESNADESFRRNFLRARLLPLLETRVPDYRASLARASACANESAALLAELAVVDLRQASTVDGIAIDMAVVRTLGAARSVNLLRHWLRSREVSIPSADRLGEFVRQIIATDSAAAHPSLSLGAGFTLAAERGRIRIVMPGTTFSVRWMNERALVLPHGRLSFDPAVGEGIAAARVPEEGFEIRPRVPGVRLRVSQSRPRRTLKNLMQEAGIPGSLRQQWPLLMHRGEIVAVPGLGVGVDWRCPPDAPGWVVRWQPFTAMST